VEFNKAGESEVIAALIEGKARVNTQNISPSVSFITEINLSLMFLDCPFLFTPYLFSKESLKTPKG
jgi:hypothetical protein